MLVRAVLRPRALREPVVHAYFHDTDLLDRRRATALRIGLALLGRRRVPTDLDRLADEIAAQAPEMAVDAGRGRGVPRVTSSRVAIRPPEPAVALLATATCESAAALRPLASASALVRAVAWSGVATLVLLDAAGSRSGSTRRSRSAASCSATVFWDLLWEAGPARVAAVPAPDHVARLLAGRALRAPGAEGRLRARRLLARARRAIALAFGIGTGYDFTTSGLIPTACIASALAIGGLRAAYDSLAFELERMLRRPPPRAARRRGRGPGNCRRSASSGRGSRTSSSAVRAGRESTLRRPCAPQPTAGRAILNERDVDEETLLDLVETAHREGIRVRVAPKTTELLAAARRVRARPGRAALRAAPAGARRHRLGGEAGLRRRRQRRSSC